MFKMNALTVSGKSTSEFPFLVYVEKNDGFRFPKKKNQLTETTYSTGAIKNDIRAWPPIPKSYTLYCPTASLKDMRQIKAWAVDHGELVAADEPDVFYEILDVDIADSPIDDIAGYRVDLVFTVQPFGYELNQESKNYTNGQQMVNHTNAPMFPRINIYGNSSTETTIQIGKQTVRLRYLNEKITIESKPLEQNVYDKDGRELNSVMGGDFIEIKEGTTNRITLSSGIERIEILERWGWR